MTRTMPTAKRSRRRLYGAIVTCALGGLAAATIALPAASAAPNECSAAGLAGTVSTVSGQVAGYLSSHPETNDALTNAAQTPDPEASVRSYFTAHAGDYFALKGIAKPLTDLSGRCNVNVSPGQLTALYQAFSER